MANYSLLALVGVLLASAQDAQEPIVTDRPDFTESSLVVPYGSLQIESGMTILRADKQNSLSAPELLLRLGLSKQIEARIGLPNANWSGGEHGWDDLYLGAKVQLGPLAEGTGMALIPAVMIPAGDRRFRSASTTPEIKLVWSQEVSSRLSLAGMIYGSFAESETAWQHTLSLGIALTERAGIFIEHVLDASRSSRPAHSLHAGWTYRPSPQTQFDLHFGLGLTSNAPTLFVAGGYSVRF